MSKKLDLLGQRFGRLVVVESAPSKKCKGGQTKTVWKCKCDCGNLCYVTTQELRCGDTISCGCYAIEQMVNRTTKHHMTGSRLYKIWCDMRARCSNPKEIGYHNYGGRGITICNEWLESFEHFYNWSVNNGYCDDLTIDRIDVNGDYCPGNCKWATRKERANNTRRNFYIEYNKTTHTLAEWGRILNVPPTAIRYRLKELNWSVEKTFTYLTERHGVYEQ